MPLTSPLGPGEAIEVAFDFEAQLPKVFARTGYRGAYVLAGQAKSMTRFCSKR